MEFNELFDKYLNDPDFRIEAEKLGREDMYDEFAKKYDIPYTFKELVNLINDKVEESNAKCASTYSSDTYRKLCIPCHLNQDMEYHPLITTVGNKCRLTPNDSHCLGCDFSHSSGCVLYCGARSNELDVVRMEG